MKDCHFYIRAGGTFSPLDINLVEDLFFLRRLRPKLEFDVKLEGRQHITAFVHNLGQATAKDPYVVFSVPRGIGPTHYELDGNTPLKTFIALAEYQGMRGPFLVSQKQATMAVHPGAEVPLVNMRFDGTNAPVGGRFGFQYWLYAENMPAVQGKYLLET